MAVEPEIGLERLIAALKGHYEAAVATQNPDSEEVIEAESYLRDAFFTYDNLLFTAMGIELPFDMLVDEDEDFSDDEDDEEYEFVCADDEEDD